MPLWFRISSKIIYPANLRTDCWLWRGAFSKKRRNQMRPVIHVGGRGTPVKTVARILCEAMHGPPPTAEHEAGHVCPAGENAECVSPYHLVWQTRWENELHKRRAA